MQLKDYLFWAFRAIYSHKLRSILTITGFAVGISAVTLLSALGEGMRVFIMQEFTQFGSRIVAITPGKTETFGLGGLLNTTRPLSLTDAISLESLNSVEYVVPVVFGTGQIKTPNRSRYTDIAAVGAKANEAWQIKVASGRFLPEDNPLQPRSYAVLGHKLKLELFGNDQALGEFIQIANTRFRIIGVMEPKGEFLGTDLDDLIYIPAQKGLQLFNRESLMEVDVFYQANTSAEKIASDIKQRLIERHGIEDFTLITQDAMLSSMDNILSIIKLAAGGLGGIALLVGGVGILTIFSITVTERKQEIGLLRAIGFNAKIIQRMFLLEALTLAIVGGIVGYSLIVVPTLIMQLFFPNFPIQAEWSVLLIALLVSAGVGAVSGIKPAYDASRLPPIEALRDE
ncbi:MAG: ABC transporter permease [Gammaproteobacteria bacterium]|nr:ABC transporter permease [Gammaproteobacteria bacterium]